MMTKGEVLEYAIKRECRKFSLVEWCDEWGVTIDDFEEFLRLGKEAFDAKKKEESNLISKQDTQKRLCEECPENAECVGWKYIECRIIADMPSAQPERKKGKWIPYLPEGLRYKCSECESRYEIPWHYCPNCGSYNGGESDDKGRSN